MNAHDSPTRLRRIISWLEIGLGVVFVGVGGAFFVPLVQDKLGDPHGMYTGVGAMISAIGATILIAGLALRVRGRWPLLVQAAPVVVVAGMAILLT